MERKILVDNKRGKEEKEIYSVSLYLYFPRQHRIS
jgi:hypothetical protein